MGDEDYAFLKAGLGNTDVAEGPASEQAGELTRRLMSLCVALVCKGGKSSATYVEHAGRKGIVAKDILMGLQYQAKVFMTEVTDEDIQNAREDVDTACDANSSSSSESESEEEGEEEGQEKEEEWSRSECSCTVCAGMNEANETWDSWSPEDEVLAYLKSTTNKYIQLQNFSHM